MGSLAVRAATKDDLAAINDIYNHYVIRSTTTYDVEPITAEERGRWFAEHGPEHPVIVAEQSSEVLGFGSLSRFRTRFAYRHSVEDSVFVRHDCFRQGIGSAILADLVARAKAIGHHTVIGGIDGEQEASILLHARHGFAEVARLREVGYKFGRRLDVVFMQRML
ncbi:MAG: GNAT family N-acetyltransferase [Deltaproteobacteria bacterium RBG_13_65_10]|nr:MAG: GNAT family N-acetyltransferase [Deltaproteobacteria bacterium RBG_13_65_10]